ncbi:hypothetical protein Thermus77412_24990 [Thermus antranikianii]
MDEAQIHRLAESIEKVGLLEPILVRPLPDGRYEIIAGERRYRAFLLLRRETIPALIVEADDQQVHDMSVAENTSREDLTIPELVLALRRKLNLSDKEFSRKVKELRNLIKASKIPVVRAPQGYEEFEEIADTFGVRLYTLAQYAYLLADVPLHALEILAEGKLSAREVAAIRRDPSLVDKVLQSYRRIKPNADAAGVSAGYLACQDVFIGLRKEKARKRRSKVDRALDHLKKAADILLDLEEYEEHAYKLEDLIAVIEGTKAAEGK